MLLIALLKSTCDGQTVGADDSVKERKSRTEIELIYPVITLRQIIWQSQERLFQSQEKSILLSTILQSYSICYDISYLSNNYRVITFLITFCKIPSFVSDSAVIFLEWHLPAFLDYTRWGWRPGMIAYLNQTFVHLILCPFEYTAWWDCYIQNLVRLFLGIAPRSLPSPPSLWSTACY